VLRFLLLFGGIALFRDGRPQLADDAAHLFGLGQRGCSRLVVEVPEAFRQVKVGANFAARAFGDAQETVKFGPAAALETFCDIGWNRDTCSVNLIGERKVTSELPLPGKLVHMGRKIHPSLPRDEILETLNRPAHDFYLFPFAFYP